jgi:hypothetical protein
MAAYFERLKREFSAWWRAPVTWRDRILGAVVGAMGFFWLGVLGRLGVGSLPVSLGTLASWALGVSLVGVALGLRFPKATTCFCFPFALSGASN